MSTTGRNIDDVINTFGDMSLNSKEVNQRSLMDLISEVGEKQKQQQILLREIESRLTRGKPLDTKTHPFQVDRVATSVQTSVTTCRHCEALIDSNGFP